MSQYSLQYCQASSLLLLICSFPIRVCAVFAPLRRGLDWRPTGAPYQPRLASKWSRFRCMTIKLRMGASYGWGLATTTCNIVCFSVTDPVKTALSQCLVCNSTSRP
ncbi:hypothetical protein GGR57DRAFT_301551 [Xylariaceae sp. FL1272]|nr:hypothetical protein GGR57DRAFT_301551 [Xylariaceae sp. FL1272]